jgi:hypothetical protein
MFKDKLVEYFFDLKKNLILYYGSQHRLTFLAETDSKANKFKVNQIFLSSPERTEAVTYRGFENPERKLFWTAGKISQRQFAEYWFEAMLYFDEIRTTFLRQMNRAAFKQEGYCEIIDILEGDQTRHSQLCLNQLPFTNQLPMSMPVG